MGARPEGAFDGNAFMVTPAMMSILGATAEDMEETLKALGYRAEARKAEDVMASLAAMDAEWKAAEAAKVAVQSTATTVEAGAAMPDADALPSESDGEANPAADAASAEADADQSGTEATETEVEASEAPPEDGAAIEAAPPPANDGDVADAPVASEDMTAPVAPEEELKPVLLWRPQRHDHRPHGQRERPAKRHDGPREDKAPSGRDGGDARDRRPRQGKPPHGDKRPPKREERGGKPSFEPKRREEKPVKLDPDSPFAKLAALREQLKK
jgi:ATP-dependent RNA helicase SUPV3L1/SUV3